MKKRLLFAMVALMGWVGMSAADYVYTTDARYKLTGENLVLNGDFTEQNLGEISTFGWSQNTTDTPLSTDAWAIATGVGPNGENALERKDGSASELCQIVPLTAEAYYVISFDIKANANFTSVIEQGKTNSIDVYVNASGTADKTATDDSHYFKQIATTINVTDEWQTVAFALVPDTAIATFAVISMEQLPAGTQITNVKVVEAEPVYDLRIAERALNWAQRMYEEPAFTKGKEDFITVMNQLKQVMANERASENESTMMNQVERLNSALETYLDANTENIASNDYFANIDIVSLPKLNRKDIKHNTQRGGFLFLQDGAADGAETNWVHGNGGSSITKWIIKGNDNGPGTVALVNKYMPAGKYFIAADMRTGTAGRGSNDWSTVYDIESPVVAFVGTDSAEAVMINGHENYTRVYYVADVKEGEDFIAGFWWGSLDRSTIDNATPEFEITNFQIRAFEKVSDVVAHKKAFETYFKQWDAACGARKKTYSLIDQPMYPWGQNDLKAAKERWEPLFSAQYNNWWCDADGKDTGVATTEQLTDWANYQGVDTASVESAYKQYGLVRGFQYANDALVKLNQPFADLKDAITAAKAERVKGKNAQGDRDAFKTAIETAITTLNETISKTTDETRVADSTTIADAKTALEAAQKKFLDEVENSSNTILVVDIDFSNPIKWNDGGEEGESYAYVEGNLGKMIIAGKPVISPVPFEGYEQDTYTDKWGTHNSCSELGSGTDSLQILRLGKTGTLTVDYPEVPGDGDVINVSFDLWFGYLVNSRKITVELQNAAGERIAGFQKNSQDGSTDYNDLNLDFSKSTSVGSSAASNAAIAANGNRTSIEMIIDYNNQTMTGNLKSAKNGLAESQPVALSLNNLEDTKIARFVVSTTYDNDARRCWFDNLKISKMGSVPADMEQDITEEYWPEEKPWEENYTTGIREVGNSSVKAPIYSIFGTRLQSIPQKGLYIMNSKKYVVK